MMERGDIIALMRIWEAVERAKHRPRSRVGEWLRIALGGAL